MLIKRRPLTAVFTTLPLVLLVACTKPSPSADERNRAFLKEAPSDLPVESKQFLASCVQHSGVRSYNTPGPKYPAIVQKILDAEAKAETELFVSNVTWADVEMLGIDPGGSSKPPRAGYGSDWKAGFTIVPHLLPVPTQIGGPLPAGVKIVFRWVPTEKAAKTRYTALPPEAL